EIEGARYILLNITSGKQEVTMDEVTVITDYIQEQAGLSADLIWGNCIDETLESELSVTIIATGFQTAEERKKEKENERVEIPLTPDEPRTPYVKPINQFVQRENQAEASPVPQAPAAKAVNTPAQQADLFSAAAPKPQLRNSTPENDGIIRHNLAPQEEPIEEKQQEDDGYEVKVTPSTLHFELPTTVNESTAETKPTPDRKST